MENNTENQVKTKAPYKKNFDNNYQMPKLHKCVMLHYKTNAYIGKVHSFSFPEKGEIINFQVDDDVQKYKVAKREFSAGAYDRTLECTIYLKPTKK